MDHLYGQSRLSHPSEKYAFVNWDDVIPNIWTQKNVPVTTNQSSFLKLVCMYDHVCIMVDGIAKNTRTHKKKNMMRYPRNLLTPRGLQPPASGKCSTRWTKTWRLGALVLLDRAISSLFLLGPTGGSIPPGKLSHNYGTSMKMSRCLMGINGSIH